MQKIKLMVNGIPGNMAVTVARQALNHNRFELISHSLTGPEIEQSAYRIDSTTISLAHPDNREELMEEIKKKWGAFITIDYTHPSAVNSNAGFYCEKRLPFVMGTTGGDRDSLEKWIRASSISAVIAPNMAKQIVGFQAMMAYASKTFPGLFKGYTLSVKESHQAGKADTSGTAKAIIRYFSTLGIPYTEADITRERDPGRQLKQWGIPEKHLDGHGWHTYSLDSHDKTVHFEFTHNINGRDVYVGGTLDAVAYLNQKIMQGVEGNVYTMIDVLKGV